ncbi:TIGR01459 family HAD-type hydrolase [Labrys monachus]|uniref:HAD superfamily hydrolase (TIGR01459 family) n=1 Tax=Labrys monachus TaxID=217067 RepID=A0ABU0FM40_9HYPH|nr:TIGR01459 family HAD-type hydrolase [Labrys monachus]MDQ0395674.1 HAD superfamily hydrolase (TIGR01459 family) [Labrys monachus]
MNGLPLFGPLSAAFGVVFLDQYGVLHDGRRPYPGAVEALRLLRQRGTRTVIISNSGKPGEANAERMARLGFARDLYDHFLTSGDVARAMLERGDIAVAPGPATRCLTLSSSDEHDLADAAGFSITEHGADADLVIIGGSQGDRVPLDAYERQLGPAAARGVPCLCTNPDRLALGVNGTFPGAGAIAALYASLGGPVTWIGKPHPAIYAAAAALVGSPRPQDILCVGDSVEHDIAGAHRFGAVAALVRTGIHADASEAELVAEFARWGAAPDIVLAGLEGG